MRVSSGFTLAELLIALVILGVIATFTIPKVLQGQTDAKRIAIIKESAAAISGAFEAYKQNNSIGASTTFGDMTAYMNYIKVVTTGNVDGVDALNTCAYESKPCNSGNACVILANGAIIRYPLSSAATHGFGGTGSLNATWVLIDWDGMQNATSVNDPGAGVYVVLYPNGRTTDWANILPNTVTQTQGPFTPTAACTPNWFSWK